MNPTWRRSTHSSGSGNGQCVEVACLHTATHWRHSTRTSGGGNGNCVETLASEAVVAIRDSKDCSGIDYPILVTDRASWQGFTRQLTCGNIDR